MPAPSSIATMASNAHAGMGTDADDGRALGEKTICVVTGLLLHGGATPPRQTPPSPGITEAMLVIVDGGLAATLAVTV